MRVIRFPEDFFDPESGLPFKPWYFPGMQSVSDIHPQKYYRKKKAAASPVSDMLIV
jgi:hypothetical protein